MFPNRIRSVMAAPGGDGAWTVCSRSRRWEMQYLHTLLCVTSMQWIMTALHCNRRYYVFVVCGDTAVLLLLLLLLLLSESFYWGVVKIRYTHQSTVFFL